MKETIKKSFIGGIVFLLTVIIGGLAYAAVSNTITSGTQLTSSMWNTMAGNYQYKLNEEVNTGKKWIDGKDIYRKVITVNSIYLGQYNIIDNVGTFTDLISYNAVLDNDTGTSADAGYLNDFWIYGDEITGDIKIWKNGVAGTSWNNKLRFIIEFTK